ncbi:MAG: 4Fe-4S dicluster domain-containing protein [Pseudomonadota bacterium]
MGHLVGKDVYHDLARKVDGLHVRAPFSESFYEILKSLYSEEEAQVVVRMPYTFSSLDRVAGVAKMEKGKLEKTLKDLCAKGLVMDIELGGQYRYMPSPMVVGIFEFTMMRTGDNIDPETWGRLFHDYMTEGSIYRSNFAEGSRTSIARALPHEETVDEFIEILDYEKTGALIDEAGDYAVGLCSCRHKKEHTGERACEVPLGTCTTFGQAADYLVRNRLARRVDKAEILDIFARSRDLGLVFSADNVRKRIMFICHCCGCCCGIMDGINHHGLTATLVTSSFIAQVDQAKCNGCGKCARACHIRAVEMRDAGPADPGPRRKKSPVIDEAFCVGCGVCALKCDTGALRLKPRPQRVIHPETTFERVILQCLERGTLENQLFDNPQSRTQDVMRYLVGGFLRLSPVKKALMSDALRSTFLSALGTGVKMLGKGHLHEL